MGSHKSINHAAAADKFIANESRTDWHNASVSYLRKKRDVGAALVREWETLRSLASEIKNNVLGNLDQYLEQFEENAKANGVQVHWAVDAESHNKIVTSILERHKVKLLVKSKSMLTEECHLNPHLESRGIEVVDTDLGERIIQMRDEGPSHIVAPAIHIKKEEVGELFHDQLHSEAGATDPQYLTEVARQHLREKFLQCDAALTGVNFAVAETGGVVVCTNEGNADMGAHMVPLQIHCMGIEKIIPRQQDLGVFLRLLARSATGQPITIYSSHHQSPKEGGEMHIVIVDNGRSKHLGRDTFRNALKCIRCGACMNTCPVYRRSGGYSYGYTVPGPIGSILTPGFNLEKYKELPFASTLCGACSAVCPTKINIDEQLYKWRQKVYEEDFLDKTKEKGLSVAGNVLSSVKKYKKASALMRWALRWLPRFITHNRLNAWAKKRELPELPDESFRDWYRKNRK